MTNAETTWFIKADKGIKSVVWYNIHTDIINIMESTFDMKKTHWTEYVKVNEPDKIKYFIRVRVSNKENVTFIYYTLEMMDKYYRAKPEEIELLRKRWEVE
jgi:hypothetical protein